MIGFGGISTQSSGTFGPAVSSWRTVHLRFSSDSVGDDRSLNTTRGPAPGVADCDVRNTRSCPSNTASRFTSPPPKLPQTGALGIACLAGSISQTSFAGSTFGGVLGFGSGFVLGSLSALGCGGVGFEPHPIANARPSPSEAAKIVRAVV